MKKLLLLSIFSVIYACNSKTKENMTIKKFNFSTSYNQFYIEDKGNIGNTGSPDFWNEEAFNERLALENGIIGVGTQSYGDIKGEIEILKKPSTNIDLNKYDHIVEGGINIQSGELQISDCPNRHLELSIKIDPGKYKVRIYSSNLASVKESDLPNDTDNDYYRVEIWPSENIERKLIKQYKQIGY